MQVIRLRTAPAAEGALTRPPQASTEGTAGAAGGESEQPLETRSSRVDQGAVELRHTIP